jgi:uncharacterized protein (TIGR03118 family)
MSVLRSVSKWFRRRARPAAHARKPARARLGLESLDARELPSATSLFQQTNLVSDLVGLALNLDPTLINAWGISAAPNAGAFWVSSSGGGLSELYLGDVGGTPITQPFKVTIPGGKPTGQVFNINQPIMGTGNSNDFSVTDGTNTGAAVFLFASKTGAITGWHPGVGAPIQTPFGMLSGTAEVGFQATDGAIYTGLAAGDVGTSHFLYAADFHNGKIDVIDGQFHVVTLGVNGFGTFNDPHLPAGFAPFNVQNLGGKLYVTYAQQDAARDGGSVAGQGKGFVDVFDTSGHLLQRVATRGQLNAPWGVAITPAGFGSFGGDLLVGNFGDGHIDAYDPTHNYAFAGQLRGADGKPVTIDGLWGLQFGNGASAGDANTLYFSAGPNRGTHGLFGSLKAAGTQGHTHVEAVGADAGGGPRVRVIDPSTGAVKSDFFAFEPSFRGGVRVASGDVNGDGVDDVVAAAGAGGAPRVVVFDGATGQQIRSFFAFESGFTGGVNVATGDVDGDGFADIVVGAGAGGGSRVEVFSGKDGSMLQSFFAFDPSSRGGVTVAAADTDGDGLAEVIAGAGAGNSAVGVFDRTGQSVQSFSAFAPSFTGGVTVAAGDVDGDGLAEIVVGAGAGGGPAVGVFDAASGASRGSFFASAPGFTGGVRVATTTAGGQTVIATGLGPNGSSQVGLFDAASLTPLGAIPGTDPTFLGGIYVG